MDKSKKRQIDLLSEKSEKNKKNQFQTFSIASIGETNLPTQKSANTIFNSKNSEKDFQNQIIKFQADAKFKSKSEPNIFDYYGF